MLNGAVPPFDPQGGLLLAAARAAWFAALSCGFGALLFRCCLLRRALDRTPPDIAASLSRRLLLLGRAGLVAAIAAGLAWLILTGADLADTPDAAAAFAVTPEVLGATAFGHFLLAQLLLVAVAAALPPGRAAAALAGLAVLLQAGHGHAASMEAMPGLLLADAIHVLSAATWLGCLPPLAMAAWMAPQRAAAIAARDFTPLGRLCVLGVAASAAFQGWALVGDVPGLVGTAYGWVSLGKLVLLGVLLGFAATNRYALAPSLLGDRPERGRTRLLASLAGQTAFGVAVVAAAALLTALPPSVHEQPVWPFALRISLDAVREDPDFRREVVLAIAALVGAIALLAGAAVIRRRWALAAVPAAAIITWAAAPHLDLLLATANPASYFHSPTGFTAASIARGAALYPAHCAACHGAEGRGDGPAGVGLAVPPADLTAPHLFAHSDGELFWWLSHGIDAPEGGGLVMPGFADALSEEDRWALIDVIRARNTSLAPQGAPPGHAGMRMGG